MTTEHKILIVGLGMMGGSYAKALSNNGYEVYAIDCNQESIDWAVENKLIKAGYVMPHPENGSCGDLCACVCDEAQLMVKSANIIIFALYPTGFLPWLRAYHTLIKPGALVTDMLGVKGAFVSAAQDLLCDKCEFIASHPMAGSEKSGVQYANERIFQGANFIITPTERNTAEGVQFVRQLADILGFSRTTTLSVPEHDALISYVSQLTHVIAVCLMNAGSHGLERVTGDSFRDLTRIADINTELWSELMLSNAPALLKSMDSFMQSMQTFSTCLSIGDAEGLKTLLGSAGVRRRQFNKKSD